MARRAFYSFHYIPDNWRVSQVRNMGVVDGNKTATDNAGKRLKNVETKQFSNGLIVSSVVSQ